VTVCVVEQRHHGLPDTSRIGQDKAALEFN
jgi:hypothetical protein